MKYREVIKLLDEGFTRDEIIKMNTEETEETKEETKEDNVESAIDDLKSIVSDLKKEIIANNIINSSIKGEDLKTGDDVIANIINPDNIKGGK